MELKGKKINFLGDSLTEGVGVSCFDNVYHQVMKREYDLAEARAYGVSGARYTYQLWDPDPSVRVDFCYRATQMDKDADVIVVLGGTNDFGYGNIPVGAFGNKEPDTFYGACHTLYTYLTETYPDAVIVICTPPHSIDELNLDRTVYQHGNLDVFVNVIREMAEHFSLPVVDLYATIGFQPFVESIREKYMPDGIHPNDLGTARIAKRIGNFLLSL